MKIGILIGLALALGSNVSQAAKPHRGTEVAVDESSGTAEPGRYGLQHGELQDYRLGTGDKVKITVFNEPTLSGEFAVAANGMLSIPLIGNVKASGQRPTEVAEAIQGALANGYLRSPQVSAEVTVYRPYFILGEVKAPGQYPYGVDLTALNAIATAQGFTPRAEHKFAYIRREGETDERKYRLSPDLHVLPGDTIRLGERYF